MFDFEEQYRRSTNGMYFGINRHEDYIEIPARRDALAILTAARDRCAEQDMRDDPETLAALEYLGRSNSYPHHIAGFRKALDELHPIGRYRAVTIALCGIERGMPAYIGKDG